MLNVEFQQPTLVEIDREIVSNILVQNQTFATNKISSYQIFFSSPKQTSKLNFTKSKILHLGSDLERNSKHRVVKPVISYIVLLYTKCCLKYSTTEA